MSMPNSGSGSSVTDGAATAVEFIRNAVMKMPSNNTIMLAENNFLLSSSLIISTENQTIKALIVLLTEHNVPSKEQSNKKHTVKILLRTSGASSPHQ